MLCVVQSGALVITHYRIIGIYCAGFCARFSNGRIVKSGGKDLALEPEKWMRRQERLFNGYQYAT